MAFKKGEVFSDIESQGLSESIRVEYELHRDVTMGGVRPQDLAALRDLDRRSTNRKLRLEGEDGEQALIVVADGAPEDSTFHFMIVG